MNYFFHCHYIFSIFENSDFEHKILPTKNNIDVKMLEIWICWNESNLSIWFLTSTLLTQDLSLWILFVLFHFISEKKTYLNYCTLKGYLCFLSKQQLQKMKWLYLKMHIKAHQMFFLNNLNRMWLSIKFDIRSLVSASACASSLMDWMPRIPVQSRKICLPQGPEFIHI